MGFDYIIPALCFCFYLAVGFPALNLYLVYFVQYDDC